MVRKVGRLSSLLLAFTMLAYPLAVSVPLAHAEEPPTYLTAWPSSPTADTTGTFGFTSSEENVTYECSLDWGDFEECLDPYTTPVQAAGTHHFEVRAVNEFNESDPSPESHDWTILDSSETFGGDTTISAYTNISNYINDLQIDGSHNPTLTIKLEVTNGSLRLGNDTDLVYLGSQEGSSLIIKGMQDDLNNALPSLIYEPTVVGTHIIKASILNEGYGYDPDNRHIYQQVDGNFTWAEAKAQAELMEYGGTSGYLATITSQDESDVISEKFTGGWDSPWIAASDAGSQGTWSWRSGPDAGTEFWQGLGPDDGGLPINDGYSAWGGAQPDNSGGNEDCATTLIYNENTTWNDADCTSPHGYLVEFGDGSDLPELAPFQIEVTVTDFDFDHDGIIDRIEEAGPNDGDANGNLFDDGVTVSGLDRDEANVTSFVNTVTGKYSVLETDCNLNSNVSVAAESSQHKDPAYDYNAGLIGFTATGCDSTATITQYFYGSYDPATFTARKYNSVTNSYTTIPGANFSTVTIGGQTALKLVYQIVDNGPLDQNPITGTITDPAGPATAVLGVPNTGIGIK